MNLENAAALLRDDIITISIIHSGQSGDKLYTYKCLKSLANDLVPGQDMVLVSNANGIIPAHVQSVHSEPQIDPEGQTVKWAFQKINQELLNNLLEEQKTLEARIQEKQREHYRQNLKSALGLESEDVRQILSGNK